MYDNNICSLLGYSYYYYYFPVRLLSSKFLTSVLGLISLLKNIYIGKLHVAKQKVVSCLRESPGGPDLSVSNVLICPSHTEQ